MIRVQAVAGRQYDQLTLVDDQGFAYFAREDIGLTQPPNAPGENNGD